MLPQTSGTAVNRCLFQFMLCIYYKCYSLLKKKKKNRYSYNSSVKVMCYTAMVCLVFNSSIPQFRSGFKLNSTFSQTESTAFSLARQRHSDLPHSSTNCYLKFMFSFLKIFISSSTPTGCHKHQQKVDNQSIPPPSHPRSLLLQPTMFR